MVMRILVVDDDMMRHNWFDRQYSGHDIWHSYYYEDAIDKLSEMAFDQAFLDHDLGQPMNGSDLALWMAAMDPESWPKGITIHSWNSEGADRMRRILEAAGHPKVTVAPFSTGG
jgi:hypothetical protein